MPPINLTETAYWARKVIKYGALFILFLIAARLLFVIGTSIFRAVFPAKEPPPNVAFGKLPALPFPKTESDATKFSYSLQTPTGELPELAQTVRIYFMPEAQASFLDLENATKLASDLGFSNQPQRVSETVYRFAHARAPSYIEMNIVNKTFSVNYSLAQTPEIINLRPASTGDALKTVQTLLKRAKILPPDLEGGEVRFDFVKVELPRLVPAISLSEANFVRVNLFRQNYGDFAVLTPQKARANVWFLVSGDRSQGKQIVGGEYHYFPIETSQFATYPLKKPDKAWDELITGKAHIASTPEGGGSQITVRRVYLTYYDSGRPQRFLQPIYVFEGDGGFLAYVPAVAAEFYAGN